jgi:hypothetical protein
VNRPRTLALLTAALVVPTLSFSVRPGNADPALASLDDDGLRAIFLPWRDVDVIVEWRPPGRLPHATRSLPAKVGRYVSRENAEGKVLVTSAFVLEECLRTSWGKALVQSFLDDALTKMRYLWGPHINCGLVATPRQATLADLVATGQTDWTVEEMRARLAA